MKEYWEKVNRGPHAKHAFEEIIDLKHMYENIYKQGVRVETILGS